MSDQIEMPKYRCHKEVWAIKISVVEIDEDGSALISPQDNGYATFATKRGWGERFKPANPDGDLGYYVMYEDGYESWSPSDVFEAGYTLLTTQEKER